VAHPDAAHLAHRCHHAVAADQSEQPQIQLIGR
jgi:hypothetical protein